MENSKQWYVVYTKAGHEKKVCDMFRRKKLESFYPANKMTRTIYGKERISFKPVLERYVFVCLANNELNVVKSNGSIINFVHWLTMPITVSGDDIFLLRRFFDTHDDIQLQKIKISLVEPASLFNQFVNDIEETHFTLPVLGYTMTAQASKTRVKIITVSGYQTKPKHSNKYAEAR
ncbi:MAG: UpxY family transcription antiterminator [Bacteroidota bacterium]|nr:UpxY family transcription antiterminator [Bacteroidota bacterium]